MAVDEHLHPFSVPINRDSWSETVGRYPVRASTKDVNVVDAEVERFAKLIRILNEFSLSQSDATGDGVQISAFCRHCRCHRIQRLITIPVRIPQLWLLNSHIERGGTACAYLSRIGEDIFITDADVECNSGTGVAFDINCHGS
jgi:hypothetical protein